MRNAEIAAALRELGILYDLDGADRYRVLAYQQAARTARDSPVSLEQLAKEGRLTELPGIGKTLAEKVVTLIETGSIPSAEKLKKKFPASLVEVTRVPGLGAKTARRLYDELGIEDLEGLRAAAEQGKIRELRGLGPTVEENVLAALETMPDAGEDSDRRLLSDVLPVAREIAEALRENPASGRVEIAGSARRWTETCKDIDLVATAADPAALIEALGEHALVSEERAGGDGGAQVLTHAGMRLDLRIVPEDNFGDLLQHFTGSAAHNVQLRERALGRGLSVSEHGVAETDGKKVHRFTEEAGVYELLGLPYIEPELREGRGEIEAGDSGELPELVRLEEIRGDLHSHTTLSDGRNSLEEMADGARRRGYAYFAITDHSASHGFGDHVTPKRLAKRIEEVRVWNESAPRGFRLLAGSEVNIGTKGELDYPDELLGGARLGGGKRPHLVRDLRAGDDRAGGRSDGAPAGRLHRPPHRAAAASPRALCGRRRAGRRDRGPDRDDAGDQRQPEPARPLRAPREARRRGGGADRLQHRRPWRRHPAQHAVLRRDRPPRVALGRAGGEHPALAIVRAAPETRQEAFPEAASAVSPDIMRRQARDAQRRSNMQPQVDATQTQDARQTVASYPTYAEAQRAVDSLSDAGFPVEVAEIVGYDIRLVERVTGRLTNARAAGAGAATGAWFGLFIGLLVGLFTTGPEWLGLVLGGLLIGAVWGAVFGFFAHWVTRGQRDFTSVSNLVAGRYELSVPNDQAQQARELLGEHQ